MFGRQLRFDLAAGFPLVTTKRVHLQSVIYELLWFLRGDSNVAWLQRARRHGSGTNGPRRRRARAGVRRAVALVADPVGRARRPDQQLLDRLRRDPNSRRNVVSAWNVGEIPQMALPPCHALFQFYVADGRLSCQLYQRSADLFLGVPFNIAGYALLTHMMAAAVWPGCRRVRLDRRRLPHL